MGSGLGRHTTAHHLMRTAFLTALVSWFLYAALITGVACGMGMCSFCNQGESHALFAFLMLRRQLSFSVFCFASPSAFLHASPFLAHGLRPCLFLSPKSPYFSSGPYFGKKKREIFFLYFGFRNHSFHLFYCESLRMLFCPLPRSSTVSALLTLACSLGIRLVLSFCTLMLAFFPTFLVFSPWHALLFSRPANCF